MEPLELASAILAADEHQDVERIIELTHPEAIEYFRRDQLQALGPVHSQDLRSRAGRRTKELKQALEENNKYVLDVAYKVASITELEELAPTEFWRRRLVEHFRAQSPATQRYFRPVGHVFLDPDTSYVVVERRSLPPSGPMIPPPQRLEVMTVRKYSGYWLSMMDGGCGCAPQFVLGAENYGAPLSL